ncbi:TLC domain-containing protein 3A [Plutella xylostella]|uniref:TLC domain-containing protein 3A n=1 Tax=Plutella xylostella TaxID=51655 RepID=UPI0020325AD0|nr:TLC domain-containing protein 3A [Plutella xylostella]
MQLGAGMWAQAAAAAGSLLAATATVLALDNEDRVSIPRGLCLTALGFVFFPSLFSLSNNIGLRTPLGDRLRQKYSLSVGDVMDINNKLVSAVQALLCVVTGAVVCLYSCSRDVVRTSHYMSEAYAWFGAAYFFYDIWSMYTVYVQQCFDKSTANQNGPPPSSPRGDDRAPPPPPSFLAYCRHDPVILLHHVFIGGFGFAVIVHLRGDLGDCVFGFAYLMELSTPFVSLRGVLSRVRQKSSPLYVVNGLVMLATFCVCRVLALPAAQWLYARHTQMNYFDSIASLPRGCKISICILLLPQLYWFYLMSRGAVKVLFETTPAVADSKVEKEENKPKRS